MQPNKKHRNKSEKLDFIKKIVNGEISMEEFEEHFPVCNKIISWFTGRRPDTLNRPSWQDDNDYSEEISKSQQSQLQAIIKPVSRRNKRSKSKENKPMEEPEMSPIESTGIVEPKTEDVEPSQYVKDYTFTLNTYARNYLGSRF